jgi:alcohol dehydrogenase, propanol-preferring
MLAMTLTTRGQPLQPLRIPVPSPGPGQVLLEVRACGVCRTDLHVVDGDLVDAPLPIVPGHEIVGRVVAAGAEATGWAVGTRVGVPWLGETCGRCVYCASDRENLCDEARFTGYHLPGGYADYVCADVRYCVPIPDAYDDAEAAPLLCAGLIGHRALRLAGEAARVGLYGFGAAAHIVAQIARHQGREVFAFVRPGDAAARSFALRLGAAWVGDSTDPPPVPLDAAILFAPVGALVPEALSRTRKGGRVVCAGIHMSDIPAFPYRLLWGEREVRSVANLTREDARTFMPLAVAAGVRTSVQRFALARADVALARLRSGALTGAAVLIPERAGGAADPR